MEGILKILVVDDDLGVLVVFVSGFDDLVQVLIVENGQEGFVLVVIF